MDILRSLIFVPGNRADMLGKARQFDADVIVADLEDSVPNDEKDNARQMVSEMGPALCQRGQKLVVRVNSLDTGLTRQEIESVAGDHLYGVSIGKAESPIDINECHKLASAAEKRLGLAPGHIKFIPWIENARAIMGALDIATASPRIVAIAFGAEDYTDDMGVERTEVGDEVHFARCMVGVAARAARIAALDGPFVAFRDPEGLRADCQTGLKLGFKGKFAIHPAQLDIINETFTPGAEEITYAKRVVEAWLEAEEAGRGSTSLDGKMIDVPVVKRAQNLLALAERLSKK
ncbi:MAG: CoA ester lyase [Dehalococcoidia bacterium]|nr:CoA ester lyase [Dehalococcoidia bacterium]